ncbi:MAG: hypothetical protein LW832_00585 [Parachlamydia sp.]|jgi:hypothetical protein|nr:hypothetical protein [Parachlamydia sp.]
MDQLHESEKNPFEDLEQEERELLDHLAGFVLESMEERQQEIEPFEHYASQLRAHLIKNTDDFKWKFLKGYESLLKEMEH